MANGDMQPAQPFLQEDPAQQLLQQMIAGQQAQTQLEPLQEQMKRADKLRQLQMPQGRSAGGVYQAANPLEFIGSMLQASQGRSDYDALAEQAAALRGDVMAGQAAQLQQAQGVSGLTPWQQAKMAQEKAEHDESVRQFNLTNEQEQSEFERNLAVNQQKADLQKLEYDRKLAQDEVDNYAVRDAKVMMAPDGRTMVVGYNDALGMVDADNPREDRNFAGFTEMTDEVKSVINDLAAGGIKKPKEYITAASAIKTMNQINERARGLSANDKRILNRPLRDMLAMSITPKPFEEWVKENWTQKDLTQNARSYLESIYDLASITRHARSGAQLTKMEKALADAYLASADGISVEARQRRMDLAARYMTNLIDTAVTGAGGEDKIGFWKAYERYSPVTGADTEGMAADPDVGATQLIQQGVDALENTMRTGQLPDSIPTGGLLSKPITDYTPEDLEGLTTEQLQEYIQRAAGGGQ